jgi:hypothetical protein
VHRKGYKSDDDKGQSDERLTCRCVANCSLRRAISWASELDVMLGSTAGGWSSSRLTGCGVGVGDFAFSFPLLDDYMRVS